jgi:ribosomal protein S12 methylthiotransferase
VKRTAERPVRVGLISLGCAKNLVDAEIMLGTLLQHGVEITNEASQADVLIINTCSFIDSAQQESVDSILQSAAVRDAQNRRQALIVAGCLPQRFREELPKLLPEVDAFMGVDQITKVTEVLRHALAGRAARLRQTEAGGRGTKVEGRRSKAEVQRAEGGGQRTGLSLGLADPKKKPHDKPNAASGQPLASALGPPPSDLRPSASPLSPPTSTLLPSAFCLLPSTLVAVTPRPRYIPDFATARFRLTPRHFAYVKIAEGCNHPCSFCIIPRMRGSHRSRPQADILAEARALLAQGVKELNLISQDSTCYGLDLRPRQGRAMASPDKFGAALKSLPPAATTICTLLRELNGLPGDFWIRLLYTHPAHWTDDLIQTLAQCPKVARYVDIPIQHIHSNMLERMRRETSREHIIDLLRRIRAGIPGIALRTTFIVGFPGETEDSFQTLLDFIRAARFERLGVFTYSREKGTRAAGMAAQVPDKVKRRRRDLAMAAQHAVALEVAQSFVGRTLKVLVENQAGPKDLKNARISSWEHGLIRGPDEHLARLKGPCLLARSEADAPDIDGRVYVQGQLPLGRFAQVRIIGHTDYDLIAEPA